MPALYSTSHPSLYAKQSVGIGNARLMAKSKLLDSTCVPPQEEREKKLGHEEIASSASANLGHDELAKWRMSLRAQNGLARCFSKNQGGIRVMHTRPRSVICGNQLQGKRKKEIASSGRGWERKDAAKKAEANFMPTQLAAKTLAGNFHRPARSSSEFLIRNHDASFTGIENCCSEKYHR